MSTLQPRRLRSRETRRCLCMTNLRGLRRCNDLYSVRAMFPPGKRAERGGSALPAASAPRALRRDERGVVVVEYVMVLLLVCVAAGGALVLLGIALARFFAAQDGGRGKQVLYQGLLIVAQTLGKMIHRRLVRLQGIQIGVDYGHRRGHAEKIRFPAGWRSISRTGCGPPIGGGRSLG